MLIYNSLLFGKLICVYKSNNRVSCPAGAGTSECRPAGKAGRCLGHLPYLAGQMGQTGASAAHKPQRKVVYWQ